jgi:hypothetical protein
MSELVAKERVDLSSFQAKLKAIWKDQAPAYFDLIKKYVQAKLSKKELDVLIKNLLVTEENSNIFSFNPVKLPFITFSSKLLFTMQRVIYQVMHQLRMWSLRLHWTNDF